MTERTESTDNKNNWDNRENRDLKIRIAEKNDVPLILEFIKGIAEFEKLADMVTADEATLTESMFGERPYSEALIAELDGVPAGFTIFFHNFSTFVGKQGLYIEDIFVKPEFRGKGIGKALFLYCVKLAKERKCGRMEWVVLDWNPAREFYEYFGAGAVEGWHIYRMGAEKFEKALEK